MDLNKEKHFNAIVEDNNVCLGRQQTVIGVMGVIILALATVVCLQAIQLTTKDQVRIIKHEINNDRHDIVFSYRDTIVMDQLDEAQYNKLLNDHILPK